MTDNFQALEKALNTVISTQKKKFADVFQFVQDLALLWDEHKRAMESIPRKHQVNGEHEFIDDSTCVFS